MRPCHRVAAVCGLAVVIAAWTTASAQAKYARPDLVSVPIDRLVDNLEELAKKDPKAVEPRFNLARLHAMAFALKTDTAQVRKGQESNGAWFDFEPAHVPFQAKPTDDKARLEAAAKHLARAIDRYDEVLKLAPDNLSARLGHAWCTEQAKKKDEAIKEYRKLIDDAWAKEKDLKSAPLGWHSITAEAAGYLIPLLDADKDKTEIATLKERSAQMDKVPRPVTPIVIPLRDGLTVYDLEDRAASVAFDADGTGLKQRWTWITKDAGWLVHDPHRTGQVTSALQWFGSVTFWLFWDNGYQALAALDDNGDGVLTGKELEGLAIWHDANGDGICQPGEVRPLADYGIVALSCRYERDPSHPDRIVFAPQGVVFRDGRTRPTYDILLHRQPK